MRDNLYNTYRQQYLTIPKTTDTVNPCGVPQTATCLGENFKLYLTKFPNVYHHKKKLFDNQLSLREASAKAHKGWWHRKKTTKIKSFLQNKTTAVILNRQSKDYEWNIHGESEAQAVLM